MGIHWGKSRRRFGQKVSLRSKNCRKAAKQGLSSTIASEISEYKSFYQLYIDTMSFIGSDKYYLFNLQFFTELLFKMKSYHKLILIWYNNKIVGGFILLYFGEFAHNYLSAGSSMHRNLNIND